MKNLYTSLYTFFCGKLVGQDQYGNKYYENKKANRAFGRKGRWVIYAGIDEPSKVPGHWFGWLHFQTNKAPASNNIKYNWVKQHMPNLTGTSHAYCPTNAVQSTEMSAASRGGYETWKSKKRK